MLSLIIIQARETTLNCHEVFAQNFSGVNIALFRRDKFAPLTLQS